ncbi:TonB-dependent receptor [Pseudomaricurvus sp.]|uniref:TonB-dependent receptor n=1 Tax=Pseudomaricurvus sp. TaxID=2004510 RepID=UPI003F6C6D7D
MKKITALFTACSPVILLAQAVHAQNQPADLNAENLIEEVVVTATRRSQSLSEVPIAVSVVSKADIQNSGTYDVKELNQLSPSVLISSTGSESNTSARIRGIGTVGDNIGLESSVAIFVDGVYRSRTGVGMGELGDVQQIEVLRGPQGTLFGRNASAGLISITTAAPTQEFSSDIAVSYGNYDERRLEANINGGLSDTVAGKLEGIFYKRDGFYEDVNTGYDLNNRDRYFLRGQLMIEPQDNLSLRIIGDYSKQKEDCCGAVFATDDVSDHTDDIKPLTNSQLLDPVYNPNIGILMAVTGKSLDELYPSMDDPYDRKMAFSPGRDYGGTSEQWGLSAELNWTINDMTLTSITAYREYDSAQSADAEYHYADILHISEDGSGREFETFSQELRLQGTAFNNRLDWLVGGYYSNESLQQGSTLKFGGDYGAYTSCLVASGLSPALMDPSSPGCLNATGRFVANSISPGTLQAFDLLYSLQNLGDDGSVYQQDSETFALFTHNIISLTDTIDLTVGMRYTYDEKKFDADFNNNNTVCADMRNLSPGIFPDLAPAFLTLACQGNSTSELNALNLEDSDSTEQFTGTLSLSWRPSDHWMFYGSYSRGYKAGGYNLDRSALGPSFLPRSNSDVDNLKFDPEIVDAFEIGAKYHGARLTASAALFYQSFENFQLNTFDGTVYIVESINGCDSNLNGLDGDNDPTTGGCDSGDVTYGVISEGIELEASYSVTETLNLMAGMTYANTRYADDLVGDDSGAPLNPSLRRLPGEPLSNAPDLVTTAAISWTPTITDNLTGLVYLNVRHSDSYNTGSNLAGQKVQDGYSVVNGRIGLVSESDKWSLELWGKNLLDEEYAQVIFDTAFIGSSTSYLADPRSYGVTLRKSF